VGQDGLSLLISFAFSYSQGSHRKGRSQVEHQLSLSAQGLFLFRDSDDRLTDVAGRRERPQKAAPLPIHIGVSAHDEAIRTPSIGRSV
jgi:hypothetical protein